MKVTIAPTTAALRASDAPAGSLHFVEDETGRVKGASFTCPCCKRESWLPINREGGFPSWQWDGNREAPTLHPSIHNSGMPCKWHGWLRAGEWQPC